MPEKRGGDYGPGAIKSDAARRAAEIWTGARRGEHVEIERLLRSLTCVPTDHAIGEQAGEFLCLYSKSHGLEVTDALIAASSAHVQAPLWTRNRKHYPMKELTFY